ncbi:histidine kinase [Streptomyces sp. NBC_01275]|uniref:sensor histidine kinase n=1 Tax=Streptomyces sp. NBC_01275 TaxID=2903807 RepID=UPI002254710C|nr:ATP-binding protein [Streptomyces sp. NBC_01275]MCX4766561.1 histidine kinase [Streptomyces sp. NBC_01275]
MTGLVNGTKPGARPLRPTAGSGRDLLPAYTVCALTALSMVVWVVLTFAHMAEAATVYDEFDYAVQNLLLGLGFALSGMSFLARREAGVLVFGWFLLVTGALSALGNTLVFTVALAVAPSALSLAAFTVYAVFYALFALLLYTLPLWLPDGRLGSRWTRAYALVLLPLSLAQQLYHWSRIDTWMGVPNPMGHGDWAAFWRRTEPVMSWVDDIGAQSVLVVALVILVVRMVRSPDYRHGTYWVTVPYAWWSVTILLLGQGLLPPFLERPLQFAAAVMWPLLLGYLHVRSRTWYLDRAARRLLVALLLAFLTVSVSTVAAWLLLSLTSDRPDTTALLPACAVGLVVGALLRPLSRWASRLVEHYFYGDRAHPYQVVRNLAKRLSDAPDPSDAPQLLGDTVVRTLGLPAASVTVSTHHGPRELVRIEDPGPGAEHFPIVYRGEEIGRLEVSPRPGELALDPQDREAVQVLAAQAAPALASLRLYQDLQSSREQLIHTREEERRRLRHELHDGLGPALSGLRLQVDAVRRSAQPAVTRPLTGVSDGIGDAIRELRRITDGLAPAALDGADLARALRQLAEHLSSRSLTISVAVDPDPLPALPAALQVAMYRITAEALNNVVRHSHADRARAVVSAADGRVSLRIADNGDGFAAHQDGAGVGLRSMAERSEELGGAFTLTSSATGTVVDAAFPAGPGTMLGHRTHVPGRAGVTDS